MYDVEYNIKNILVKQEYLMKVIAENNGCKAFNHGYDRLVIQTDDIDAYFKVTKEIAEMCKANDINYDDLLDLD